MLRNTVLPLKINMHIKPLKEIVQFKVELTKTKDINNWMPLKMLYSPD